MTWHDFLNALIMGVVEGITEFLPISSTGHLIITGDLLDFTGPVAETFEIAVQSGAMLAACWLYRGKLSCAIARLPTQLLSQNLLFHLLLAFLPAACIGLAFHHDIMTRLFNIHTVGWALIVGGLVMLAVERLPLTTRVENVDALRWQEALKIGCVQVLSLIPGTSRAAATIIGGLCFGLSRQAATEFSFLLGIPTLLAATGYQLYGKISLFSAVEADRLIVGLFAAFVSALLAIRGLLRYISHHNFTLFAWYRIVFGALVLWLAGH
jgi:undecaprenyl-diphosphatase